MGIVVEFKNPLRNLDKKIKIYKRKILLRHIVSFITIIAACTGTFFLMEVQTYNDMRLVKQIADSSEINGSVKEYANGILKYSRDGASYLDKQGKEKWNHSYQLKNPVVEINKEAIAIASKEGNDIFVFDKKGIRGEIRTGYPIEKMTISENGIVATLLRNESSPKIVCYDAKGNVLVEHQSTLNGTGYPIAMALSPDGTMLAVSYFCIEDGVEATRLSFYNFAKDKSTDLLAEETIYKNSVIPTIFFADEDTAIAIGDKAFMIYKTGSKPKVKKTIEFEKEINGVFHNEKYVGFLLKNSGEAGQELRLYNMSGSQKLSKMFKGEYKSVKMSGTDVIMVDGKNCCIISRGGIIRVEGEMKNTLYEVIPLTGFNKYLVANENGLEEIRLVK